MQSCMSGVFKCRVCPNHNYGDYGEFCPERIRVKSLGSGLKIKFRDC
jgi:hypothetical protein